MTRLIITCRLYCMFRSRNLPRREAWRRAWQTTKHAAEAARSVKEGSRRA